MVTGKRRAAQAALRAPCWQPPLVSQVSGVHGSVSAQDRAEVCVHTPARQRSPTVQTLLSLQAVPSLLFGFEQAPVVVLQTPTSWHWSSAVQIFGAPETQT